MTQPTNIQSNDADDDLLSAYVDNDLADAERAAVEARLQREPALQAALDDLRATVALLHDLPQLAPPRSFALDPALHRPRWQRWVTVLWRFSAFAAVLLALTFTLDLMNPSAQTASTGSVASAPQSAAAPTSVALGSSARSANSAVTSAPAAPMNAEMAAPAATAAPAAAAAMAPAATPNVAAGSAPAAADAPSAAQPAPASDATMAQQSSAETTAMEPPAVANSSVITNSGLASPDTAVLKSAPSEPTQATQQPIQPAPRRIAPLRVIQIALAALVVILAGAALWVARRRA